MHMIDISQKVDESWCKPPEGFNPDVEDDEYDISRFGMQSIDRLIENVGDKEVLPIIGRFV